MLRYTRLFLCLLLVFLSVDVILSKRITGRHSYPKPHGGGLSGGGSHSGGLSGGGHGYPSSGGHITPTHTGGSHTYPSPGGSHTYPSPGGSHTYPSPGGSHTYLSNNGGSHTYPSNNGGSHGYPQGKGLSGNSPSQSHATHTTTNIHHHYNYNPPQQIRYTPVHGGPPVSYPVYHGTPPTYVYQYKDSGSKYGTLLAGLALLNLGTLGVSAYAASQSHGHSHSNYKPQPGEICKFGIKKDNGDYEETRIDCNLITSFIFQEEAKSHNTGMNSTVVTTTVTNVTTINATGPGESPPSPPQNVLYQMLPNGTFVPVNATADNTTAPQSQNPSSDASMTSSVTTITTTNTTTVNALDVKGAPVSVTPGMKCYVIRHTQSSNMRKSVDCGLLQTYAQQSLKKNSASRNMPQVLIFSLFLAVLINY